MKDKRRNYSSQLEAKATLAAAQSDKTIAELAGENGVHPDQIAKWKKKMPESPPEIFSRRRASGQRQEEQTEHLYQQIRRLLPLGQNSCKV
jgi:transposase-like protein